MEINANGSRIVRDRFESPIATDYKPHLQGGEWRDIPGGNQHSKAWSNNMQNQIRVFRAGEVTMISSDDEPTFYKELSEITVPECTEFGSLIERECVGFDDPEEYEAYLPGTGWFKLRGGNRHAQAWANEEKLQVRIFCEGDVAIVTSDAYGTWVRETNVQWIID